MDLNKKIDFTPITGEIKRFVRFLKVHDYMTWIIIQPLAFLLGMTVSHAVRGNGFTLMWCLAAGVATFIWFLFTVLLHYIGFKIVQRREKKRNV